jgi:hypothetical protein
MGIGNGATLSVDINWDRKSADRNKSVLNFTLACLKKKSMKAGASHAKAGIDHFGEINV